MMRRNVCVRGGGVFSFVYFILFLSPLFLFFLPCFPSRFPLSVNCLFYFLSFHGGVEEACEAAVLSPSSAYCFSLSPRVDHCLVQHSTLTRVDYALSSTPH